MYDYLVLDLSYLTREHLEQCGLVFAKHGKFDQETGEFIPDKKVKAEYTASYKNLIFQIFKISGKIKLSGSLHCYWNDGTHNHNVFDYAAALSTIKDICQRFRIDPKRAIIRHLEFGINLYNLPFLASQAVQNLMIHSGKGVPPLHFKYFAHRTPSEFKCIVRDWYTFKIYDKGKHYQRDEDIFRLECKATKMHRLNEMGISTLADLTRSETMDKLLGMLQFLWKGVLFNDWTIKEEKLTKEIKIQLKDWRNPNYWTNLRAKTKTKNRNKFNNELNKYISLVQEYSDNVHKIINDSLVLNWCKNTKIPLDTKSNQLVQEHLYIIDEPAPTLKRVCKITGIDISEQKENSHYLRESTLEKIYSKESELYESLKSEFGPRKKQIGALKEEFEVIAKNIRNRDSNPRKRERDIFNRFKNSLFPYEPRIPLYARG